MALETTRREWLKTSALAAAGLALTSTQAGAETPAAAQGSRPIRLSSNENPYGFSPRARAALLETMTDGNRYADPETVARLEREIAARENLKPENVVLGTGSGEVLCMAAVAFGRGEIVAPDPTFPSLMRYAEKLGARVRAIPLNARFEHDFGAMAAAVSAATALVYVCNPNNPTGGLSPHDALRPFVRETAKKALVFADEAYLEYTDDYPRNSLVELVRAGENVIVSRTFSKIYGLAGLRVGYGLAPAALAQKLKSFRMTWFNNLSVNAALAAFADLDFVAESRRKNTEVRRALTREIEKMELAYAPADANFVWLETGPRLADLGDRMRRHNIRLGGPQAGWTRVTIGTDAEMRAFVKALREIKS
jgi:histidinol-phosphate aminotransferase